MSNKYDVEFPGFEDDEAHGDSSTRTMKRRNATMCENKIPEEEERDIDQRESMSQQITEILLERVKRLGNVFSESMDTLQYDVDASSNYCSSKLNESRTVNMRTKMQQDKEIRKNDTAIIGFRGNPSRVFTAKQLFGELAQAKTKAFNQATGGADNNSDNQSVSNCSTTFSVAQPPHKAARLPGGLLSTDIRQRTNQERELHSIAERSVTRTTENIDYRYSETPPFDSKRLLIMAYVSTHITLPENENLDRSFRRVILTGLVADIYDTLFWYCMIKHFFHPRIAMKQKATKDKKKRDRLVEDMAAREKDLTLLRRDLSELYIQLIRLFQKVPEYKRDQIHCYVPFAIGHGILAGFRYLCPGSRHLYTPKLKANVYETCCSLLLGTSICSVSIERTREKLFRHESITSVAVSDSTDAENNGESKDDEDENVDGEEASDKNSEEQKSKKDKPETADGETGEGDMPQTMLQERRKCNALEVGTLLKEYFESAVQQVEEADGDSSIVLSERPRTTPGTTRTHLVCRTIPSEKSRIGGSITFRKTPTRLDAVKKITDKYSQERGLYNAWAKTSRSHLSTRLRTVTTQRDNVLKGGLSYVGRFCADLTQDDPAKLSQYYTNDISVDEFQSATASSQSASARHARKRKSRLASLQAADGTISGESKGIRNKHLQGDRKVDWYANLAVNINLPPAERVIAAMEKIEASKKSERHKPRTKARTLLCGI